MNWKRRVGTLNWDAVGGFIASFLAVILHLRRFIDEPVLLAIMTSLLALLFFRDLREETAEEELLQSVTTTEQRVAEIRAAMTPPELELVGPDSLRQVSQTFGRHIHGDVGWFNLCLPMFTRRELFDILVRPMIDNPGSFPTPVVTRYHPRRTPHR